MLVHRSGPRRCAEIRCCSGICTVSKALNELDAKVSIRFQTTFLPISEADGDAIEFATSAYSYATRDANDPKNLVVLASSQGIALQQDQVGDAMIYHHQVSDDGKICERCRTTHL